MILPQIRASFGRSDALHLVDLLGHDDDDLRAGARRRLEEEGLDALLDDPRLLNALLSARDVKAPPALVFYVLVRQALLESGVDDRTTADYVASMVLAFGNGRRAYRITEGAQEEYSYLVDMMVRMAQSSSRETFLLRVHMGDFALWLTGLFPDFVEARVQRRGGPPAKYFEEVGSTGYRLASSSDEARALGVDGVLGDVAEHFSGVRGALNQVADRYFWRGAGNPVSRLLREVSSGT